MKIRRAFAILAAIAVAWAALWPLVSSVEASIAAEPVPLCHQAGSQVAIDEMRAPPAPGEQGKTHCALCIMAFYVAFAVPPVSPTFVFSTVVAVGDRHDATVLSAFQSPLPPSRAPPVLA